MSADTVPESYVLSIVPDLECDNGSFTGHVDILIRVKTSTPVIVLNSKVLADIWVNDKSTNKDVNVNFWDYIQDQDQVRILLDGYVFADRKYTVRIRFRGHL